MMKKNVFVLLFVIITIIIGIATPAFAERLKYTGIARSTGGAVLASATVAVYLAGTTTPANVYEASTGGDSVTSVISDSNGRWTFYADVADYAFTQEYKVVVTKDGYSTITLDNIFNLSLPTNAVGVLTNDGSGNYTWSASSFSESGDYSPTGTWDWSGATVTWPDTITTTTFVGALTGNADTATNIANKGADFTDDSSSPTSTRYVIGYGSTTAYRWTIASLLGLAGWTATPAGSCYLGFEGASWGCQTSISGITLSGFDASKVMATDGSGNATTLDAQNVITTGYVDGLVNAVISTSSPVTVAGQARYYINGSDSAKTFNLPAAGLGKMYCFANALYTKALTIHPATDDIIILAGENDDTSDVVSTGAATDKICVLGLDTTYWYVTSSTGTWAND